MDYESDTLILKFYENLNNEYSRFDDLVKNFKASLLVPNNNLKDKVDEHWSVIFLDSYEFDIKRKLLNEVSKITFFDFVEFYKKFFFEEPRKLSIRVSR